MEKVVDKSYDFKRNINLWHKGSLSNPLAGSISKAFGLNRLLN